MVIVRSVLALSLLLVFIGTLSAADPKVELFPAFPGAEGAGAYTPGGRGGKVFVVTTLDDYQPGKEKPIPGSLRQAILDAIAAGSSWQPKTIEIPGIVVTKDNVDKYTGPFTLSE